MRKKKVVITGGAGFIGSHLCQRLIEEKYKVICIDNFITGKQDNIRHLLGCKDFTLIEHNVSGYINVEGRVDYVLHFSSLASPNDYLKFPIPTLKVGSLGTHNALGLAKAKGAIFILASTSEVYGDPLVHPQPETYWGNVNPIGVRACYDESKRFAEALTMAYHRAHKMDTKIIRIFNTYGPRMRMNDGRVIPNFIYQALSHKPLTVYGKGLQSRSFCYIDDLVEGVFRVMPSKMNEPINLGNPKEFTILELAKLIIEFTGAENKITFKPLPQDDPRQRKPDIARAKTILGWQPKIPLKAGLRKTIAWFKERAINA